MSITKMRRRAAPVSTFMLAAFLATMIPPRVAQADPLAPVPDGTGGAKSAGQPLQPAADQPTSNASVDLSTGAAHTSYPFHLQTGRGNAQPGLGLTYDSAAGMGLAGVGWTLGVPSITRQGVAGFPNFVDWMNLGIAPSSTEDSYMVDGLHLVPICKVSGNACTPLNGPSGEVFPNSVNGYYYFRKEIDDDARYFFSPDGATWIVQSKTGHTLVFGKRLSSDTLFSDGTEVLPTNSVFPSGPKLNHPVYKWHLIRDTDATGNNTVYYVYDTEQSLLPSGVQNQGMLYLTDIYDTPEIGVAVAAGTFAHRTHLQWALPGSSVSAIVDPVWRALPFARVKRVDITSYPSGSVLILPRQIVRSYSMTYEWNDWQTQYYLSKIDAAGNFGPSPGLGGFEPTVYTTPLPILTSTSYSYSGVSGATQPVLPKVVSSTTTRGQNSPSSLASPTYEYLDLDQDGKADFLSGPFPVNVNDPNSPLEFSLDASRLTNAVLTLSPQNPPGLQATLAQLAPGALQTVTADWLGTGQLQLLWMNINASTHLAQPEIYSVDVPSGTLVNSPFEYSSTFQLPPDFNSQRSVDVDGDGLPDMTLIKTSGSGFQTNFSIRDNSGILSAFDYQQIAACGTTAMDPATYGNDTFRTMADMDGDGLPDLVVVSKAANATSLGVHVLANRGTGAFGAPSSGCVDPITAYSSGAAVSPTGAAIGTPLSAADRMDASLVRFGDLNGDHLADFAVLSPHGLGICLRYGNALSNLVWGCTSMTPSQLGQTSGTIDVRSWQLYLADLAGTGTLQVVYEPPNTQATALSLTAPPVGLLTDIKTTEGAETTLTYALQGRGEDPTDDDWVPVPIWAVTGINTTNGLTNGLEAHSHAMSYSYEHPVYDPVDRVFAGFTTVTESEMGSSLAGPGLTRTTTFGVSKCLPFTACLLESTHSFFRGIRALPVVVQESSDPLHQLRTTWNEYKIDSLYNGADQSVVMRNSLYQEHIFPWDAQQTPQQVQVGWENGSATSGVIATIPVGGKEIRRQRNVDPFDNEVSVVDFGVVGVDEPIMQSRVWQLPTGDQTGWSFRAVKTQTGYTDSTGSTFTEPGRLYFFDYFPSGLLKTVAGTLAGTLPLPGPPGQSRAAPAPAGAASDGLQLLSTIAYDAYGNQLQTVDGSGHCVGFDYDTLFSQLASDRNVYRGGCGVNPLTTTEVIDRISEQPLTVMTPAGRITQYQYNDNFGRLTEIDQQAVSVGATLGMASTAAAVKISYLGDQTTVRTIVVQTADGAEASPTYHTHSQFIDSFGDPIATFDDSGAAGGTQNTISGVHIRDSYGRIMQVYQPFTVSVAALGLGVFLGNSLTGPSTSFIYDGLGRVVQATDPNGFISRKVYRDAELAVDSYDAEQQAGGGHSGAMSTVTSDGHGRVVESRSHLVNATQGSGDFVVDVAYQSTGEPYEITQSAPTGSLTRWMQYDSLGRMVFNAEPNTSTGFSPTVGTGGVRGWTYAYDLSGQLVGSSDARGCGENIAYDGAARRVSEDYSTCDPSQTYSSPHANGDGTEAFYIYDTVTPGDLAEIDDRGARATYAFDLRGRTRSIQRQMSTPTGSDMLAQRYASPTFTKSVAYSAANAPLTVSTGANAPALVGAGGSTMTYAYTNDGRLQSLTSSYGPLIASATYDASGALTNEVLGDAAGTTIDAGYDPAEALKTYWVHRTPGAFGGAWKANVPGYKAPASGSYELQADLTHLTYGYDHVYNPVSIADGVNDSGIAAGLKPANRTLTYGDDYRLSRIQTTYGLAAGTDAYKNPPYAPEQTSGSKLYPQPSSVPATRVADQHVNYDWFGNTSSTTDNLSVTPDRSLGSITEGTSVGGPNRFVASLSPNNDVVSATYDAAGNGTQVRVALASGPTTVYGYTWDELGRLSSATRTDSGTLAVQETYAYDARGERVRIALHDPVTSLDTYTLQVFDSLTLKGASFSTSTGYEDDATTEQLYLDGGGVLTHVRYETAALPVGSGTPGQVHAYMSIGDPQGSASFVIDHDTGELVEHPTYYAYGGAESDFRSSRWNSPREDVRYTGHYDDAEVGLVYFGARYYSPLLDRWISADPLTIHGLGADLNPYAFVDGSPMANVDPRGLEGTVVVAITIACTSTGGTCLAGAAVAGTAIFIYEDITNPAVQQKVAAVNNALNDYAKSVGQWENNAVHTIAGWFLPHGPPPPAPPPPINNTQIAAAALHDALGLLDHLPAAANPIGPIVDVIKDLVTAADSSASTGQRVFAGGMAVVALVPDTSAGEEAAQTITQLHHAWPKYLGGAAEQVLVPLSRALHEAFHGGLDKILPRQWGKAYYEALSGGAREQVLRDLADYTRAFDTKYGTKLYDALVKNGFPAP